MKLPMVDAVIVGAGGGGGIVAQELSLAGWNVVLLERGRATRFDDVMHDELRSQRGSALECGYGPPNTGNPRLSKMGDDSKYRLVMPNEGAYGNNAAAVGGGTIAYGAMAWRYLPQDFRMKSTYGVPEGSTLDDWPLSYDDLEPYYTKAEWDLGVSGDAGANHFEAQRSKPYPMPALPGNGEVELLEPAAKKLGWHPFPIPMAINSEPYGGRSGCVFCPHCVGFQCEVDAKSSTAVTVIPRALATKHCRLLTGAMVREIVVDPKGHPTGVVYLRGGVRYEQPARVVVVSAAAIETARLLLNSKSKLHPTGLGNQNDWVGRNLQGHGYNGAFGLFDRDIYDGLGPGARIALCDFSHGNSGIVGGGMLANEFIRLPHLFATSVRPPDVPRWGQRHKDYVRSAYKRVVGVKGPVQEVPRFENRVEVDGAVLDAHGIPVAKLTGKRHANDHLAGQLLADKAEQWLRAAGAVTTWQSRAGNSVNGHQHQAGTCRMGNDPKTSVVDRDCRVHSLDNLYVVDGSVHVTNGGFNPSLTIQAIAYRASEKIVQQHRRRTA